MKKSIKTPSAKEFADLKIAYDKMRSVAVDRTHEKYILQKEFDVLKTRNEEQEWKAATTIERLEALNRGSDMVFDHINETTIKLRKVIFRYEIFAITVVVLTFIHVALVAIHS